jgi:DNA-directed RNA polymerase specialized sigma24 family protein
VERIVSGQEEITLLIEEIEQLPSRCQEILVQVKVFGYSVKEVARAMDIAESTVKKQLQIAAARCARALEKKQTGPGLQLLSRLVGRRGVRA